MDAEEELSRPMPKRERLIKADSPCIVLKTLNKLPPQILPNERVDTEILPGVPKIDETTIAETTNIPMEVSPLSSPKSMSGNDEGNPKESRVDDGAPMSDRLDGTGPNSVGNPVIEGIFSFRTCGQKHSVATRGPEVTIKENEIIDFFLTDVTEETFGPNIGLVNLFGKVEKLHCSNLCRLRFPPVQKWFHVR